MEGFDRFPNLFFVKHYRRLVFMSWGFGTNSNSASRQQEQWDVANKKTTKNIRTYTIPHIYTLSFNQQQKK